MSGMIISREKFRGVHKIGYVEKPEYKKPNII